MKSIPLILIFVIVSSCFNELSSKKELNYLMSFNLIEDTSPNPDAAVFRIHSNSKLRELLLSEKWDSIRFSGGLFDTVDFNRPTKIIGIAETDMPNELTMGMITGGFLNYTQCQMDSIASETFKRVEVNVYYKTDIWKLKPLGKDKVKH
jgi:hypothetical protein